MAAPPAWRHHRAPALPASPPAIDRGRRAANGVGFNRRYMPLNRRFRELAAGLIDEYRGFLAAIADPGHATVSNFRNACNTMRIAEAIEAARQE